MSLLFRTDRSPKKDKQQHFALNSEKRRQRNE